MASFLKSIFGQSKNKQAEEPKKPSLKEELLALGVTEEGADHLVGELEKKKGFEFNGGRPSLFPSMDIAAQAFNRIIPELKNKELTALHLRKINNEGKEKFNLDLLTDGSLNLKAGQLYMEDCSVSSDFVSAMMKQLPAMGTTSLWLKEMDMRESAETLSDYLTGGNVKDLVLRQCRLDKQAVPVLAKGMAASDFRLLDLQNINENKLLDLSLLIDALPPSVEILYLQGNSLTEKETDSLAKKLPDMKGLRHLKMSFCDLDTADLLKIAPVLPPSLESINLGNNPQITDEGTLALIKRMEQDNSVLHDVSMFQHERWILGATTTVVRHKLKETEETCKAKYLEKTQEQKASEISRLRDDLPLKERLGSAKTPAEFKSLLPEALAAKETQTVLNKMKEANIKLSSQELLTVKENGRTLLDEFSTQRKIPQILSPDFMANVKDFTETYNALSATDKKLFDGKDGRPTFQSAKNLVMAAAVKSAVARKNIVQR